MSDEILTLPLVTPKYDHMAILSTQNRVKLMDLAIGYSNLNDLIDKCITIEELYCTSRILAPQLGIGRILTIRQLTKSVYMYIHGQWDKSILVVDDLVHLITQRWMELDLRKIPIKLQGDVPIQNTDGNLTDKIIITKSRIQKEISNVIESIHQNNGNVMVNHFNMLLDILLSIHYRHSHEMIDITMKSIIDVCYSCSTQQETRAKIITFAFRVILDELDISKSTLFIALDSHFKINYLSNSIWNSRSHLYDVIYGLIGSSGNEMLQKSFNIPIYVDFSPNIPFKPMRTIRKIAIAKNIKNQNQIINKRQFHQLSSNVSYSPFYNDIPTFIRQINAKLTLKSNGVCVEEKLDGQRSNFHLFRDPPNCECDICLLARRELPDLDSKTGVLRCSFFSRRRTPQLFYGKFIGDPRGILTRLLNPIDFKHIDNAILDGEMVAIDKSGSILGFSKVKEAASDESRLISEGKLDHFKVIPDSEVYCTFIAFDLLYLNDIKFQYFPLVYRKDILKRAFSSSFNQRFKIIKSVSINDRKGLVDYYNKVRAKKGEGLVLKSWVSFYKPGKDNKLWVKIKPEYLGHDRITCDVVIMGKVGNNTKRGGGYLLGLKKQDNIICIGKLNYTNGIGDLEGDNEKSGKLWKLMQNSINEKLQFSWKNKRSIIPLNYKFGKTKPDFFIDFNHSLVLEISGQRIVDSHEAGLKYGNSHRLKDIRIKNLRYDKDVEDCDLFDLSMDIKLEDFIDYSAEEEEEDVEEVDSTGDDIIITKRRKLIPKDEKRLNIINPREFKIKSSLFNGKTFCVFNDGTIDGERIRKFDLCHQIKENGGEIIHQLQNQKQIPISALGDLIVIGDNPIILPKLVKVREFNVVNYQWVNDCIQSKLLIEPDSGHVTMGNELFLKKAETMKDYFGLNENKLITEYGLNEMYQHWKKLYGIENVSYSLGMDDSWELEKYHKLFNKKFYILSKNGWELDKRLLEIDILQNGGNVENHWNNCDFILTLGVNSDELKLMKEMLENQHHQIKIISQYYFYGLIEKFEGISIEKKWYLISPTSSINEKEALKKRIINSGGEVVESWGEADYILTIEITDQQQRELKKYIGKQRIVQVNDILSIL